MSMAAGVGGALEGGGLEGVGSPPQRFVIDQSTWNNELEIVQWEELQLLEAIGKGAFGKVFRAIRGHKECCVKQFSSSLSPQGLQSFVEEAYVLGQLKHPHTVLFMGVCLDADHCAVVTEYMDGGDLNRLLYDPDARERRRALDNKTKLRILLEAGLGVEYLHSKNFAHRDLKPSNILLEGRMFPVKIADFGLSGPKCGNVMGGGTRRYAAPEVLLGDEADLASDIFSFGVVICEVFGMRKPNDRGDNAYAPAAVLPEKDADGRAYPLLLRRLVTQCMAERRADRPSIGEVCDCLVTVGESMWCEATPIRRLTEPLISRVAAFLEPRTMARMRLVCRQWRDALDAAPALWEPVLDDAHLTASDRQLERLVRAEYLDLPGVLAGRQRMRISRLSDHGLQILCAFAIDLRHIDISGCPGLTDVGVRVIAEACAFPLQSLNLARCAVTDRALDHLSRSCHGLLALNLDACAHITDAGFQFLAIGCPMLSQISLAGCAQITDVALQYLASCVHLQDISLYGCQAITDAGVHLIATSCVLHSLDLHGCELITDASIQTLLSFSSQLVSLRLDGCRKLTSQCLQEHVPSSLEELSMDGCRRMGDQGVAALPSALVALNLKGCTRITEEGFASIGASCPGLTLLNLSGCEITDAGLASLTQTAGGLHTIRLTQCQKISDKGVHALSQHCPGLQMVKLSGCHRVTDDALRFLSKYCPLLRRLDLDGCRRLTSTAACYLATMHNLHHLDLGGCTKIDDLGVQHLSMLTRLRSLSLERCRLISDGAVIELALRCDHLRVLSLTDAAITDLALEALAQGCRRIERLQLARCARITPVGVDFILAHCPHLSVIQITGCKGISTEQASHMQSNHPRIDILC